jgi:Ca-activated chloride channel family protein
MEDAPVTFTPIAPLGGAIALLILVLVFIVTTTIFGKGRLLSAIRRALIAVALFGVAIGPGVFGPAERTTFSSSNDVFIVLDTTGSSAAEDYNGDQPRLEGMRSDIAQIVEHFAGARFSLITFDAVALVRVPLTRDSSAVLSATEVVQTELTLYSHGSTISEPLTLLTDTLDASAEAFPEHSRIVFYLGDGEQTATGEPDSFAGAAEYTTAGSVLGYGTSEGGPMLANSGLYSDESNVDEYVMDRSVTPNTVARSTIDEQNLEQIAADLDIDYVHRTQPGPIPGLASIEDVADDALTEIDQSSVIPLYWVFALAAFVLLLWEAGVVVIAMVNARAFGRRV